MRKFLLIILLIFIYNKGKSQDLQLFENTWYLQNLIINGSNNIPPSNTEVPHITVNFNQPDGFETFTCDLLDGILIHNNSEFLIDSWAMTLFNCINPINKNFQIIYLDDFFVSNIDDPFGYEIINESNGSKTLIIVNVQGDQAFYNTELLSIKDISFDTFSIFPNPTSNEVIVQSLQGLNIESLQIVDVNGKLLFSRSTMNSDKTLINIENLKSGLYFIIIENENQKRIAKKLVKS
ncbi:T9SS type A sorting domain-containing protein [Constantimarinum furrinae]|nr:T9SS type A sorting domain-containing protein [Constantimarinum furrinae]